MVFLHNIIFAFIYEGGLAVIALIAYFWIEPKYAKMDGSKFLSYKNVLTIIVSIPFMELLVGILLQSQTCENVNNFLCYGKPDFLSHSLFYDIFYLRVNDLFNGAHWLDYLFIPIIYFLVLHYSKDPFFSALNAGFMVFLHESLWFIFYWFEYYPQYRYEGWANDIAFFILVGTLGFIGLVKYRKYYWNRTIIYGIMGYLGFLFCWYEIDNFRVTVINNTQIGDSSKFLITQWYNDALTNEFEVFSWIIIFSIFVENLFWLFIYEKYFQRKETV